MKKEDQQASTTAKNEDQQDIEAAIEAKMRERNPLLNKTKAELRYLQTTSKMVYAKILFAHFRDLCFNIFISLWQQEKRVMEKASKTHKMRVEEFNKQLDNLTEHFDIPKVSWTK